MHISEPVTMLTDYLLAVLSLYWAFLLNRQGKRTQQLCIRFWAMALGMLALAAALGGTSHGFKFYFNETQNTLIWKMTVYATGLASFFMLLGAIRAGTFGILRFGFSLAAVFKFAAYAVWMIKHDDFLYVMMDYVPAMCIVIAFQIREVMQRKNSSAWWIIAGILLSFLAAGVQASGLTLHEYFNHNDFFHVLQMVATYWLFRGVSLLQDASDDFPFL